MPEILLHYIWQQGLFFLEQHTTDGRMVRVMSPGRHNGDAGPDFTDVRLLIDGVELVGQIEIHVHSSDWYRHHHHEDAAYDAILLHVVLQADRVVYNSRGQLLPQLELQYDSSEDYIRRMLDDARRMDSALATHRCGQRLLATPSLLTDDWKHTLLMQRLRCKQQSIARLLQVSCNDWQQAFYISLAHAFGFHTNGLPMELVAQATPLAIVRKHRDNLLQITALLLGQAGLIGDADSDAALLQREYDFLRVKFGLTPIDASLWKQGRLRPANRPATRLRQLARLLHASDGLYTRCMETPDVPTLRTLFAAAGMGQDSVDVVLINVVAPFLFAIGRVEQAYTLLMALPAEDNRIIRQWRELGQRPHSAADSQALIHLYQTCCEHADCLRCSVWSDSSL